MAANTKFNFTNHGTNSFVNKGALNDTTKNYQPPKTATSQSGGTANDIQNNAPTADTITAPAYTLAEHPDGKSVFYDKATKLKYALSTYDVAVESQGGRSRISITRDTSDPTGNTWMLTVNVTTAPPADGNPMDAHWLTSSADNLVTLHIPTTSDLAIEHTNWAPDSSGFRADFSIQGRTTVSYLMSGLFKPDVNSGVNPRIDFGVRFQCALPLGPPDSNNVQHFVDQQTVNPTVSLPLWVGPSQQSTIVQDPTLKGGVTDPNDPNSGTGLMRVTVPGDSNSYFQDRAAQQNFYYLPDAFKILRDPNSPHYPWMRLTVAGTDMDNLSCALTYTAMPVIDADRKEAASKQLQQMVPGNLSFTFNALPPPLKKPVFTLALPGGDAGPMQARNVDVSLEHGFQDVIKGTLNDISTLFNSLGDVEGAYFQGNVAVTVADGVPDVQIPFVARATDFVGEIFDVVQSVDANSGAFLIQITNAIESVIHIETMPVNLMVGDVNVPCTVTADPLLPIDLNPRSIDTPADSVTLTVLPQQGSGGASFNIDCDLRGTSVVFNKDSLLAAIMTDAPAATKRDILVKIPISVFGAATLPPNKKLTAVQISFDRNGDVTLYSTDKPDATGGFISNTLTLKASLLDTILNNGSNVGTYRYKVKKIYADGHADQSGDWVTDSQSTLFIGLL